MNTIIPSALFTEIVTHARRYQPRRLATALRIANRRRLRPTCPMAEKNPTIVEPPSKQGELALKTSSPGGEDTKVLGLLYIIYISYAYVITSPSWYILSPSLSLAFSPIQTEQEMIKKYGLKPKSVAQRKISSVSGYFVWRLPHVPFRSLSRASITLTLGTT